AGSQRKDSESGRGSRLSGERLNSTGDSRRHSGDRSAPAARRDSEHSYTSDDGGLKEEAKSPTASKSSEAAPKLVPAPPPKENPWTRKKEGSTALSSTTNVSNNASVSSADKKEPVVSKPNPWGDPNSKGKGRSSSKTDVPPGKKEKQNGSQNGPSQRKPELKGKSKEKHLPRSIDEMPKYEETKTKDFSDKNKFAFLNEDDNDSEDVS
ncbi:eukaryotic translation initiation factor 4B, partial [Biomphalaria glabrata]